MAQTRHDLQANANAKLEDAIILASAGRFSNAYYLCGYAIEIGLKACIAAQLTAETIPDKEFIRKILLHDFPPLVALAGLTTALKTAIDADPVFAANWAIAAEWTPDTRYAPTDPTSAQLMIQAIADRDHGVMRWIRQHW